MKAGPAANVGPSRGEDELLTHPQALPPRAAAQVVLEDDVDGDLVARWGPAQKEGDHIRLMASSVWGVPSPRLTTMRAAAT